MVTVNDTRYGGGGGSFAVYAGGNSSAPEVALHELGHSFSGLADEYVSYSTPYPSTYEPGSPNLTVSSTGQKWSEWLGYVDPAHPSMGPIGAYPGGGYYASGVYRPGNNSKMRSLGQPFDAVSREKIILDMYKYVDPLDTWLSNVARLVDPDKVWVDTVDPNVISLEWFVNGLKVEGAAGEAFDLSDYGYGPGQYAVMARAFDPTPWVRRNRDQLEESITWDILLTPEPATLVVLLAGAWSLARRRSRIV